MRPAFTALTRWAIVIHHLQRLVAVLRKPLLQTLCFVFYAEPSLRLGSGGRGARPNTVYFRLDAQRRGRGWDWRLANKKNQAVHMTLGEA